MMLRIGLTGGIGAGKSTVSRRWAERGAMVVDGDLIAREVVAAGTSGLELLVAEFGTEVLQADGTLDRPALASRAFANNDARARLNAILHPLIGARTAELVAAAPADAVVVQDIPLLVEGGMAPAFHLVVVVHTPEHERLRRLVDQRGMSESDARSRIAAQATDAQRRAAADVWLDNSGDPESLAHNADELWTQRLVPFENNVRLRVPMVLDAPVRLSADATWSAQAQRLIARLRLVCGERALRIDHVGCTAVPGLVAEDVLNLQITVASLDQADELVEPLAAYGFPSRPEVDRDTPHDLDLDLDLDPARWRKRFHSGADPGRLVNIHVRVADSLGQRFALLLTDWLRAEPEVAAEYAQVTRTIAHSAATAAAYASAKELWLDRAYPRALAWAERSGWSAR